ncbi:5-histidylcysteine sulfoxide synthase [Sulfurimonas sp. SAG-AH-194-L11]|nr:5-histidylcysteine sulfoxide synthase [Sulfurimonas sp. SAG-AH-194-L11]MDF1876467.1 5-histidylcysteine sulfoxide synthase [Sulfurimonas sp. SAG-AH-194-L11]
MSKLSKYSVLLDGKSVDAKRLEIKEYFNNTNNLFEKVFEVLKDDTVFYEKSEITRHPMIFYFGHTATFFINKLISMKIINERINADYESVFAVGVDEMAWDEMDGSKYNWPSVDEVRAYRQQVNTLVNKLIMELPLTLPITKESPMWIVLMAIEHERIHLETSLVLHRQMPIALVKDIEVFKVCEHSGAAPINEMVEINAVDIRLGVDNTHPLYSWDNEYGVYKESIESFKCAKYLISNGEYLAFVEDGGYEREEFWDDEGREFLKNTQAQHPSFWIKEKNTYKYRTLSRIIDMPQDWPVDVNALEAEAFCRYKSQKDGVLYQLPSEAEYRAIYEQSGIKDIPEFHESRANLDLYHYASSCPVNEFNFNGIYDVVGNVWQWSRTPIRPFKGFKVHEAYDDFSVPTFDEKHALILGSSWASSGNLITKHSRYAFRKHFYQNAGFRYVISQKKEEELYSTKALPTGHIYESDELVSQYCEFQYGASHFGVENFACSTARVASAFAVNNKKALDLGCATGRATYELAREFDSVEGIDFSVRFVQAGAKLKEDGYLAFSTKEEGEIALQKKVTIEDLAYEDLKEKVSFWQGDACNLKANFTGYDLIMATNLIDRLYNPRLFLDTIDERLNEDGILVITSPYTWQESSTAKEFWLGGFTNGNGEEVKTIDSLSTILGEKFELIHTQDLEFVIKETARKYQHTISEVSVWKKK